MISKMSFLFSILITPCLAETIWYPLPAEAFSFGKKYPVAQSMLFAFDYGHALVYERLILNKGTISDPEVFERQLMHDILKILKNPPSIKVDEADIAPSYVFTFPLIVSLFDWSHLLHQFVLDNMVSNNDIRVDNVFTKYASNKAIQLPSECKSMLFMDGHYFSKSFRKTFPSFNLLIWSYHWFQGALYEALTKPREVERDAEINKAISDFWQLISNLPDSADFDMMPSMIDVAPTFYKKFPKIAASFDNNHMLHDVVSDLITSTQVPSHKMKSEGIHFGRIAIDPDSFKAVKCPYQYGEK